MWKRLFVVLLLLMAAPATAQENGKGIIREGTTTPIAELTTLNPLLCSNTLCENVTNLLFPYLFHIDPLTSMYAPAQAGDEAVITDWDISEDGLVYIFTVRDDIQWSDGTPITATDVLFTINAAIDRDLGSSYYNSAYDDLIVNTVAPDENTVIVKFEAPTCRGLHMLDFPVIPAHVFDDDFAANFDEDYSFGYVRSHPANLTLPTAGKYLLDEIRPTEFVRLISENGEQGYEFITVSSFSAELEAFLEDEINYMDGAGIDDYEDLRVSGANVSGDARNGVYALAFNLANPNDARAYDTEAEDGQGISPVFGDIRVRQAMYYGVNVQELIDVSWLGYGTPTQTFALSGAWYENTDIAPNPYDYDRARQLLNEAGWRDTNNDGIRECRTCTTASVGTQLSISLAEEVGTNSIAFLLARQLMRLGFQVDVRESDLSGQSFDLGLTFVSLGYPYDPVALFSMLETEEDLPANGTNIASYSNPRVDELLQQTNCADMNARAEAYREVQAIMAEDLPYMPLFSPHRLYVASDAILNFDPFPQDPFWNVEDWIVTGVRPS